MKTIIITGGSSGIGHETALELSLKGHRIIAIGRNQDRLTKLANENSNIETLTANIATQAGRKKIKNFIGNDKIDVLINSAGLMAPSGPLANLDTQSWRYQMSVNTEAPLFLSQLLLKNLVGGKILNITIYSSYKVTPGLASYGISKAALNMLTEYMREEYCKQRISVGLVLPGIVNTSIQLQLPNVSKAHDIKRLEPNTVAKFLSWLVIDTEKNEFGRGIFDIYDAWHQKHWYSGPLIMNPLSEI